MRKTNSLSLDVIIVTRNRPEKVVIAVTALLATKHPPERILLIDSSDEKRTQKHYFLEHLSELADHLNVQLVYKIIPHKGISFARNTGLKLVTSDLFAFIDDDEYVPVGWTDLVRTTFAADKQLDVLCGYKIPPDGGNYWQEIWRLLTPKRFRTEQNPHFISAGNSIYRTSFIRAHHIRYDDRMKGIAAEDSVFSHKLAVASAKKLLHKDLQVLHSQRTDFSSFARQWFHYGKGVYRFQALYQPVIMRNPIRKAWYILHGLRYTFAFNYIPYQFSTKTFGLMVKDVTFIAGFLYAWVTQEE